VTWVVTLAGVGAARTTHADGAFPAPFRLFVPSGSPADTTVTTNFGLITSRDGGQSWAWTCEHGASDLGTLYQQALSGGTGRILGLAGGSLIFTDDDGCTWSAATGFPAADVFDDSFIDPSDPLHVLAIAHHGTGTAATFELLASTSGGTAFGAAPLFAAQPGLRIDGVEIARSNPDRIYLTTSPWTASDTQPPRILRSDDGGKTFTSLDASPLASGGTLGIAGVDPQNADRIFLRLSDANERLLISSDAGRTLAVALTADPGQQLSAFLRRADGTLLAAAFDGASGTLFRSTDGGASFQPLAASLHVGSFAERAGALYVLADGIADPFLVGVSHDNGDSFQGVLDYSSVSGVKTCGTDLRAACATSCLNLNNADVFPPSVCTALVGGAPAAATPPGVASGCAGCTIGGDSSRVRPRGRDHRPEWSTAMAPGWASSALLAALLGSAALARRRRRRHRHGGHRRSAPGQKAVGNQIVTREK
jgi:photosystem II stability/assembly factor-like uncharacterized protein